MKKGFMIAFIAAILTACLLPIGANIFGYTAVNRENRPLAREPQIVDRDGLNLEFTSDFDDYWQDHFGLREELVTAFHAATLALFNDTLNEKVVTGKDGFLFYSETLNDYTGLEAMSDADILRTANVIRQISEYAEANGAGFVFSVAPNKSTVYPEYMPSRIKRTGFADNRTRLYAALSDAGVDTLDFAALLTEHKGDGLLYYQQDTHWNQRGALIAYNAIMKLIMDGEGYETYSSAVPHDETGYYGDLHNFVLPAEESTLPYPEYGIAANYTPDEGAHMERDINFGTRSEENAEKSLLLYRDSFGEALIPLLSTNLGRAVYSQEFPYNLELKEEGCGMIMIELVERNIPNLLTGAPLMQASEKQLPTDAASVSCTANAQKRSGCTQLYGSIAAYPAAERIYIEVACADGAVRIYEAFPVNDSGDADPAWESESGYLLTLPEGIEGEVSGAYIG